MYDTRRMKASKFENWVVLMTLTEIKFALTFFIIIIILFINFFRGDSWGVNLFKFLELGLSGPLSCSPFYYDFMELFNLAFT